MKKIITILFVLLLLSICYSRQIHIPVSSENSPTTIELYNLKGQKVLMKEFLRYDAAPISLSNNLSNQVYIMRIKNGNNVFTRKFTPNHKIRFVSDLVNTNKISKNDPARNPEIEYQNLLRSAPLGDSVTNIVFINGMNNKRRQADINLEHIIEAYTDILNTEAYPGDYIFTLGYNHTHGRQFDWAEVKYQWKTEFAKKTRNMILDEEMELIYGSDYLDEILNNAEQSAKTLNEKKAEAIMKFHNETTDSLRKIMDNSFENKQRVIIFAHSQGNLFANELIDYYTRNNKEEEMERTEVLNIAPPTVRPSKSWWYTNKNDKIIAAARIKNFTIKILPGFENRAISGSVPSDFSRHNFWESYFHDNWKSRQEIDTTFFDYCLNLPFWEPQIYHSGDVAQINKLIKDNGLNWEHNNPESWGTAVTWTDTSVNKRILNFQASGISGAVTLDLPKIDNLNLNNGKITSIDVSKCAAVRYLRIQNNQLKELDVSNNKALITLYVSNNRIKSLDLSNNTALTNLNASKNQLISPFSVSNNTALKILMLDDNYLRGLDLSNNFALEVLSIRNNVLQSWKFPNQKLISCFATDYMGYNICP